MRYSSLSVLVLCASLCTAHETWEERALRKLDKKLSVELVDAKLSEACNFVATFTGLTIIIDPKILKNDPVINLRVKDMDAGSFIRWMTKLTETYAEVVNQAIFITDKPSDAAENEERNDLIMLAASLKTEIELPPQGVPLTDSDRVKIALKMIEKLDVKPTDFPGPDLSIGSDREATKNPFLVPAN